MILDRKYQLEILNMLSSAYPQRFNHSQFCRGMSEEQENKYAANLYYLEEHGLVESGVKFGLNDLMLTPPRITAKGIDFLENDGGLSAILGAVTIKFSDETLKNLIESKILSSDINKEEKESLVSSVRSLPGESIKHLTLKLLDVSLEKAPQALSVISNYIHTLS